MAGLMRIGIISDIHEDILSLRKALHLLADKKCDKLICLGDIVGFALPFFKYIENRNANECVRLVKENCVVSVAGNHDLFALRKVPFYKAGFNYGPDWYNLDYEVRAKKAKNKIWLYEDNEIRASLNLSSIEYLSSLQEIQFFETEQERILFTHFCAPDFSGSSIFFPGNVFHLKKHFLLMKEKKCGLSFSGHGHPEGSLVANDEKIFLVKYKKRLLLNDIRWVVVPSVARTTRENGVLIYDSSLKELEIIPLNSID
jgi:predicted phosphodiesterase